MWPADLSEEWKRDELFGAVLEAANLILKLRSFGRHALTNSRLEREKEATRARQWSESAQFDFEQCRVVVGEKQEQCDGLVHAAEPILNQALRPLRHSLL